MVNARGQSIRRRSRSRERGAAMFIVLMVIMILSGIGTFALSNARYEMQASGFTRQRYVSQQIAELGALAAMHEVSTAPAAYVMRMRSSATTGERCRANDGLAVMPPPPCFHLYLLDIELRTQTNTDAERRIFRRPTSSLPGSLGTTTMNAGFMVELTDPLQVIRPIPGAPIDGSAATPKFLDLTMTSTGVVFSDDNGNGVIDWALGEGQSAVFTSGRGHVVMGPIYGPL
jgi:hypothetical protein